MNLHRLRLRNLVYHWRGNSAVFLGVVVGTAVLTGALLVGDSLRGSLRDLALERLGWVEEALVAPRFFRQDLAGKLLADKAAGRVCPVLLLQATALGPGEGAARPQVRGVTVMGTDGCFWPPPTASTFAAGKEPAVWINEALAHALRVSVKGKLALRLQKPSAVPRESILGGAEKGAVDEWTLPVGRVLEKGEAGGQFSLRPEVGEPLVAYVPLEALQEKLGLAGRCNALLASGTRPDLNGAVRSALQLEDWGLVLQGPDDRVTALFQRLDRNKDGKLRPNEWRNRLAEAVVHAIDPGDNPTLSRAAVETYYHRHRNYLSLESRNLLVEPAIAEKVRGAAEAAGLRSAPTLVYLANTIASGKEEIPYSVVVALDPTLAPPLGPFLPPGVTTLADDQVALADWKDSPLPREAGEEVTLRYFPPEHHGDLKERSATFRLAGFVPLSGVSGDPDLTPEFPGITDKLTIDQWDPPFPYDNRRVKDRDEKYWTQYRTTPKAYVTLKKGQELWGSRFGDVTSFRLAPKEGTDLAAAAKVFRRKLLDDLSPAAGGLVFRPVKANALEAASTGTDFGQLFLGFSFFLIAAALLLVGLLFRLNLDRRAAEVGLLAAVGYRRRAIFLLLLAEGSVLAAAGAVAGSFLALLYARGLLRLLDTLWPGGGLGSFLRPHCTFFSLAVGAGASFAVSVLTIAWAARSLGKVPPRALLAGQTAAEATPGRPARSRWAWPVAGLSVVFAVVLVSISGLVHDHEMRAMTFFGSGALLLTACLAAVSAWMRSGRHGTVEGVGRLGVRNAARHPARSLLTAGLLASAAFLVVAVDAFQRTAEAGPDGAAAANGGFALVAESDLPLFLDLNSDDGRQQVRDRLVPVFRDELKGDNAAAERRADEARDLLGQTKVFAFRVRAGDDASCLNLYKPQQPRLLGVPDAFIDRGGFQFAEVEAQGDSERANPWLVLRRPQEIPPAFGEKNTVVWMLKSDVGKDVEVSPGVAVRVEGLLQDSIFQSSLLVWEKQFLRLYPGHEGYNFFLIQTPAGKVDEVQRLLNAALADRGFQAAPTATRLASYLAVENTYLKTFQALGALGLVLGTLGLAVVLLRGVWERRGELALLRALGYRRGTLGWLVLAENAFLLVLGVAAGTASALVSVAPHLAAGVVPWVHLLLLLALVLAVGLVAGGLATMTTLRAPLVPALRRE